MVCSTAPEHDADHGEANERRNGGGVAQVARQALVATDLGERPLDDPTFWQNFKSGSFRSLNDLQSPNAGAPYGQCHLTSGVAAISENAFDEREQASCPAQQVENIITVPNIGRMNDDVQQEAQRVNQDVSLATLDLLARAVARRIDPSPLFACLWLSASR